MQPSTITLTVRSENGKNLHAPTPMVFVIDELRSPVIANQNPFNALNFVEAGDSANQMYAWILNSNNSQTYYWGLTLVGGVYYVKIYLDKFHKILVASGSRATANGVVYCAPAQDYSVSAQVTIAYSADDNDYANTIKNTANYSSITDLQLYGESEFAYRNRQLEIVTFTVEETVTQINLLISGTGSILTKEVDLDTADITTLGTVPIQVLPAAPSGYIYEVESGIFDYTRGTANITGNLTADLITTSGDILANATNALSGGASKVTNFIDVAGLIVAGDALNVAIHTGDPTKTTATASAKVIISYKLTAV